QGGRKDDEARREAGEKDAGEAPPLKRAASRRYLIAVSVRTWRRRSSSPSREAPKSRQQSRWFEKVDCPKHFRWRDFEAWGLGDAPRLVKSWVVKSWGRSTQSPLPSR